MTDAPHPPRWAAGDSVGPYRIIQLLGTGGMGEVYLAEDTRLHRMVALKCVTRGIGDDVAARARALREAQSSARLTHPNIAGVFDVFDQGDGSLVIVMEYVPGESLRSRIARGPCDLDEALSIAIAVAGALDHAHRAGVVHCDIKPSNIQLTGDGGLKVLDFGIARTVLLDGDAPTGTVEPPLIAGSPGYMSPEQALGLPVDARTDIFSLGVVLFEMLSGGQRPFETEQRWLDPIHSVLADAPHLERLPASVRQPLKDAIATALRREPGARFQSAAELIQSLRDRQARRRIPDWVKAAAAVALIAAAAFGAWRIWHRRPSIAILPAAATYYDGGVSALQEGAYLQATRALEHAAEIDPLFALTWARLGEAQLELDRDTQAKDSLLKAMALMPDRSALPVDRRLSLEAAMAMVRRDYGAALRAYSDLAARQPSSSAAAIDLGRAYEASGATGKALESYKRAGDLDQENPAAFLRLAILLGRSRANAAAATGAFSRATDLYRARGRVEGEATVAYERGVMLARFDRAEEALASFERARQLAESIGSDYLRAAVAFRQSSVEASRGNYAAAEALASQARTLSAPFAALHAFGLVDVGNISVYAGRNDKAEQVFREAIAKAVTAGARRAEARARLALATVLVNGPRIAEAVPEATLALDYYVQAGFVSLQRTARTVLIQAQEWRGDLQGAQANYEALLRDAMTAANESDIAQQRYALAGVLLRQERYVSALEHCDDSLQRYRKLKAPYESVHSSLRRSEILMLMGRIDDAIAEIGAAFAEGSSASGPNEEMKITRRVLDARLRLVQGEYLAAAAAARSLLALGSLLDDTRAEAERILTLALVRGGRAGDAVGHLAAARKSSEAAGTLPTSGIDLAEAEALLASGKVEDALKRAVAVADLAERQGRQETAWIAGRLAFRAASQLHRDEDTAKWRSFADARWAAQTAQFDSAARSVYTERADLRRF